MRTPLPNHVRELLGEIAATKMAPIRNWPGHKRIYKMVLLLSMLESDGRGPWNWWTPITPQSAAPFFHHVLTHWDDIRDVQFSDKDKEGYRFVFDDRSRAFTERLIRSNPMRFWGRGGKHGRYNATTDSFWFDVEIPAVVQDAVYEEARMIAVERIRASMPYVDLPLDFYDFSVESEIEDVTMVAERYEETEREAIVKTRIGQGKIRTLLLEQYDHCVLCAISHPKLLIASHIKRWSVSSRHERLDLDNLLLFCPLHDRLFDRWMFTFDASGKTVVRDDLLLHPDYHDGLLAIPPEPLIDFNEGHRLYLSFHSRKFAERSG